MVLAARSRGRQVSPPILPIGQVGQAGGRRISTAFLPTRTEVATSKPVLLPPQLECPVATFEHLFDEFEGSLGSPLLDEHRQNRPPISQCAWCAPLRTSGLEMISSLVPENVVGLIIQEDVQEQMKAVPERGVRSDEDSEILLVPETGRIPGNGGIRDVRLVVVGRTRNNIENRGSIRGVPALPSEVVKRTKILVTPVEVRVAIPKRPPNIL